MVRILLVGIGYMGKEYLKALLQLLRNPKNELLIVGNTKTKAKLLSKDFPSLKIVSGGLEKFYQKDNNNKSLISHAIVCSPVHLLFPHTKLLIQMGIPNILVEKPGALYLSNILKLKQLISIQSIKKNNITPKVWIGYNRRYFPSCTKAKQLIEEDGGVITSFSMELTERWDLIQSNPKFNAEVKNNWFLANTSHITDLAFYLVKDVVDPSKSHFIQSNKTPLPSHPSFSCVMGSGTTLKNGIPFVYKGDWGSAGRWGIEICTPKRKLIFCPVETLKQQLKGSFSITDVELPPTSNSNIKMGILEQTRDFMLVDAKLNTNHRVHRLVGLDEQLEMLNMYRKMTSYDQKL